MKSHNIVSIVFILVFASCSKLIEIKIPAGNPSDENLFSTDAGSTSVLTGIYSTWSTNDFLAANLPSISLYAGLSSDEFQLYEGVEMPFRQYFINEINPSIIGAYDFWGNIYQTIYRVNLALERISNNSKLSKDVTDHLVGEAKFVRAFCYFYLVNLYGDVPLALSSDYKVNSLLPRKAVTNIWEQIVSDLVDAKTLLPAKFLDGSLKSITDERVRPTSWAANAMLARVYLYLGMWNKATIEADAVISNIALFKLATLSDAFKKNSTEAIFQIQSTEIYRNTPEAWVLIVPQTGPDEYHPVYLRKSFIDSFEIEDKRREQWTGIFIMGTDTLHYPYKYKSATIDAPITEYTTPLRLAELYLIRAEAKAHQNLLIEAISDLNVIRERAGLLPYPNNLSQGKILTAILKERKFELFAEWGHRWFDLKRTSNVNLIMPPITILKGGTWEDRDQWYPIPLTELSSNPNLKQTLGY